MNLFNEQLKTRQENDDATLSEALKQISGSVTGKRVSATVTDERLRSLDAINQVLGYFRKSPCDIPEKITKLEDQIDYAIRPHGLMYRTVSLEKGWYKNAIGVMIAKRKNGGAVTLLPHRLSGYYFFDENGEKKNLNSSSEELFEPDAILFYQPFPNKKMSVKDLMIYAFKSLSVFDFVWIIAVTLIITLIGLITPEISKQLYGNVVESKNIQLLVSIAIFSISVSISSALFGVVKGLVSTRISTKMGIAVQAATMMRVLSLPTSFFKKYSSGEITARAAYVSSLVSIIVNSVMTVGLSSIFSLIYIAQIFKYAPALVVPALLIILATVVLSLLSTFAQMKVSKKSMELSAKDSGLTYSLVAGVQKIKLAGAEKRAFAKWGTLYSHASSLTYNPPALVKLSSVFSLIISLVGTIVLYICAVQSQVSLSDYYAFNSSYGMVSGAFLSIVGLATTFATIKPVVDLTKPILETEPEAAECLKAVNKISGNIEINNVTFRYSDNMPFIFENLTLKIKSGQYIAIVGKTGCGKSTLIRMLLGFEKPKKGAIYYDGKDLSTLDLQSLRKKMGVVTQDGKLMQGDIYSNIIISAPHLSEEEAWEAAETAGIADDIRAMPMGMHTMVAEGAGGISGGQKQRIMIARAIAPKPRVLIFDEATSALDNITQKQVSDALAKLKCTRIVVAHRLSTIKQCDRIVVIDGGRIIEDGTYDELIAQNGFFAELVERQRVDKE